MADDPVEALERQVRQLTREMADVTRQVEHEQKMRGFLEDRVARLESSVHGKVSRSELFSMAMVIIPFIVAGALILSLLVSSRPHVTP